MSWPFHSARWYPKKIVTDGSSKKIFAHYKLFTTAHSTLTQTSHSDLFTKSPDYLLNLVTISPRYLLNLFTKSPDYLSNLFTKSPDYPLNSLRPFICTHEKTRQPLNGFSWNLTLVTSNKICERRRLVVEVGQTDILYGTL